MLVEQRLPTISSVTTLPVHNVDISTKLFVSPVDVSVPSDNHPIVPIMDEYLLSLKLFDDRGYPYPIVSLDGANAQISFDGASVYQATEKDMMLIDGLNGRLAILFRRVGGSVIGTGAGQVTLALPIAGTVLNDSVLISEVDSVEVPVKSETQTYSPTGLNVLYGYMEPANDLLGYTFIYMGADGFLLQGHFYRCVLIDGHYTWQSVTPGWVDNERWIEWED